MIYTLENHELKHAVEEMLFHLLPTETLSRADTAEQLTEPLALLYRHLDPDDLEDADELLEEIESIEPPETLDEAVEDLVRAILLLADVGRPQPAAKKAPSPNRGGPPRRPPPRR